MRFLSSGQRTRASDVAVIDVVPARAHVEVHVEVEDDEPAVEPAAYRDVPTLICGLAERVGSLTDGLEAVRAPLPPRQSEALSFVRDLFAYAWAGREDVLGTPPPPPGALGLDAGPPPPPPTAAPSPTLAADERPGEVLRVLGAGPQSARELAEVIGVTAATALRWLRVLELEGRVRAVQGTSRVRRWELSR